MRLIGITKCLKKTYLYTVDCMKGCHPPAVVVYDYWSSKLDLVHTFRILASGRSTSWCCKVSEIIIAIAKYVQLKLNIHSINFLTVARCPLSIKESNN